MHGNRALQIGVWVRGEVHANSCLEVEILARAQLVVICTPVKELEERWNSVIRNVLCLCVCVCVCV